MARETKCDDALTARVCERLKRGLPETDALQCEGIGRETKSRWKRWAAEGREPFVTFWESVACAQAQGTAALFDEVRDSLSFGPDGAVQPDPRMRLELLSRTREGFQAQTTITVKAQAEANGAVIAKAREVAQAHPEAMTGAQWFAALLTALLPDDAGDDEVRADH